MNELMRVAGEYFHRMEGRHLYPGWKTRHWFDVLVSGTAFVGLVCYGVLHLRNPLSTIAFSVAVLVAEAGVLLTTERVARYRRTMLLGVDIKSVREANAQIDPIRVAALEELLKVPASQFLRVAKDAQELMKLNKEYRLSSEQGLSDLGDRIVSNESRSRLWPITIALLTCVGTLIFRGLPADFDFVTLMLDNGAKSILSLLALTLLGFGMYLSVAAILGVLMHGIRMWLAKLRGKHESNFALRYFMRDLIRLHSVIQRDDSSIAPKLENQSSNVLRLDLPKSRESEESRRSGT